MNFNDFLQFQNAFGAAPGTAADSAVFDKDDNGLIDFNDFLSLQNNFGLTL